MTIRITEAFIVVLISMTEKIVGVVRPEVVEAITNMITAIIRPIELPIPLSTALRKASLLKLLTSPSLACLISF